MKFQDEMSTEIHQHESHWGLSGDESIRSCISERDSACLILTDLNYDDQLVAIRKLLRVHRDLDQARRADIQRSENRAQLSSGFDNQYAVERLVDQLNDSVYDDAAHSMAAVGMLAPFIESLFQQAFQGIGRLLPKNPQSRGGRGKRNHPGTKRWDCHYVWAKPKWTRGGNIVTNIMDIAADVGLSLPSDLKRTLEALFAYRNQMFHCGLEWPSDQREKFQTRIMQSGWPSNWFSVATSNEKPWVFYLTDTFIELCLDTVEEVITGIGKFYIAEQRRSRPVGGS